MKRLIFILALLTISCTAYAQYTGPWTQTWNFNDGLQGWSVVQGSGYWVNPAWQPNGPTLPDGGASNAGAGNLYAPDGTRFQISVNPTNSFVLQVDAWLPNLMPLNIDSNVPGNGLSNAGIGAITVFNKHMYIAGNGTVGMKIRDHSWDNTDRTRSWLLYEDGVARENMWDKWVTLQFVYNLNNSGKFTGYVYTPFDSPVHDGPGWYAFASYDIHPNEANQFIDRLILGSVNPGANSWTQAQFDNVKFFDARAPIASAVPEPSSILALGTGMIGLLRVIRRKR